MKKILIAHQSSIPHYRIAFYNALVQYISAYDCTVTVVYDSNERRRKVFFKEDIDVGSFRFKIKYTTTLFMFKKKFCVQTFLFTAWNYDIIIVENAINNLAYPLTIFYKLIGKKVAYWGHGRDLNNPHDKSQKRKILEGIKLWLVKQSDAFFAYSESVESYLLSKKISKRKIHTVYNTIDLENSRTHFIQLHEKKERLSKKLVFTGRLTKSKRIDFLLRSFEIIHQADDEFELLIIGSGSSEMMEMINSYSKRMPVRYEGSITNESKLASIYSTCDFYIYPGYVGLGAIHSMCFNLIPVVIDSKFHKPEFDYLNETNSVIIPEGSDENTYAIAILDLYKNPEEVIEKKQKVWPSISHLTIDNMAEKFSQGINKTLNQSAYQ